MNQNQPPRYIDANQVRLTGEAAYDVQSMEFLLPVSDVLRCIRQTPTADVVRVVRCGNCANAIRLSVRFHGSSDEMVLCTSNPGHYPFLMRADEFCSRGKEADA